MGPIRNEAGLVIDARDAWLSTIAFHVVHDAIDRENETVPDTLAELSWSRFEETTDLSRPRQDSVWSYALPDARKKVAEKLRLHRQNRLPPRQKTDIETDYVAPESSADEARAKLDRALRAFCDQVIGPSGPIDIDRPPSTGIHATVGLMPATGGRVSNGGTSLTR